MSDEPELRRQFALDRFWDDLITRGSARASRQDVDPMLAEVIRRLQSLDTEPEEDPAFGPRLWENLMHDNVFGATIPLRPNFPGAAGRRNGQIPLPPRTAAAQPRKPGRVQTALSYAVTIALIVAVLAMIFIAFSGHRNVAEPPPQGSPVASPSAGWPTMLANNQRTAATTASGPPGNSLPSGPSRRLAVSTT